MPTIKSTLLTSIFIALSINFSLALKHNLVLTDDHRLYFSVSSFGYLQYGLLEARVDNLIIKPDPDESEISQFGFALIKTDQSRSPFIVEPGEGDPKICALDDPANHFINDIITLTFNTTSKKVLVKCTSDNNELRLPPLRPLSHSPSKHVKRAAARSEIDSTNSYDGFPEIRHKKTHKTLHSCPDDLPLTVIENDLYTSYSFNFSMQIEEKSQEGFYYFTFHNCKGHRARNSRYTPSKVNMSVQIEEKNWPANYLSAGVIPLPQTYFILSVMFFFCGCVWVNFISRQKESALKIHTLMTVLVFAKSFSLLIHGINYHYIALYGQPVVTWAYIYYATRSVKGALFFITLALIGSGWSFVKHILSDKDKKIIMVIVGLQVIAHIAEIVLDESSEGEASNEFWAELCSLVDLFSCVAILYPIGWSVRHLEEASRTDGKAAINLKKLELFKRFYIISTIYIYITRIVTFVLLSMLTFRYSWVAELVSELATFIYFVITGYYFQPIPTNPYLLLSTDYDLEEDILFSMDAHDMANTSPDYKDYDDKDGNTKVTRRLIEDIV